MGKSTISMAIFNCYVSSPEGSGMKVMVISGISDIFSDGNN